MEAKSSPESLSILRILERTDGRLLGRFDRNAPFVVADPANPGARETVDASIVIELHNAGWIQIDEAALIADLYTFQISPEGRKYLQSLPSDAPGLR